MNNRVRKVGALLAGVAALTLPTITGVEAQVQPVCGQTITQSTTLAADLGPCPNFGLIIGADGIVLDPPTIPSTPFGSVAFDLHDQNPNCDNNQWIGNRYRTAFPACTTIGGQQI